MDLPTALTKPDLVYLDVNDTIPSNIDPSTISYLGGFLPAALAFFTFNPRTTVKMWNNGVSHSFHTRTVLDADVIGNGGWTTIETVLIRLNTSYTPSGRFPVYSNGSSPDINGVETRIGYDSAVCVQKYEPWIIETYNTSIGSPSVLRIVQKEYGGPRPSPSGSIQGAPIANTRNLNTTGKNPAFYLAHDNSINQVVKDNGRDYFYAPSLTVGPPVPSYPTLILTLTCSTGCFFHRRWWTRGIYRTLSRSVRCFPRAGQCRRGSTIPRGIGTHRRTVVCRRDTSICHLSAVAADQPPDTYLDSGNHWRTVRADVTVRHSTKRIWGL